MFCAELFNRFRALLIWSVIGNAVVFGGIATDSASAQEPLRLKVMTYNIHHAEGTDGVVDIDRIARVIVDSRADLVAVQEVDVSTDRVGRRDQAAQLIEKTGLHGFFGKAIDFQGGQYGQLVLSRFPIKNSIVHQLPTPAGQEQRIAVEIQFLVDWQPLIFASTHLDHQLVTVRQSQMVELNRIFTRFEVPIPVILAGDFNAESRSEEMRVILQNYELLQLQSSLPTMPSHQPQTQIDFVLGQPMKRFQILSSQVVNVPMASDHLPVLVEVEFRRE